MTNMTDTNPIDPDQIADPSPAVHEDPEYGTDAHAEMFMLGNLLDACTKHFKPLAVPWSDLDEREQTRLLERLHEDLQETVKKAVKIIAANGRVTFRAEVEAVQFKGPSDVNATLKMVNTAASHSLADVAGGFVTVVIEQIDDLLAIPESALKGEPDQKPLFDASVDGTSGDAEPEEMPEAA